MPNHVCPACGVPVPPGPAAVARPHATFHAPCWALVAGGLSAPDERWVALPGVPGHEGTPTGRLRRALPGSPPIRPGPRRGRTPAYVLSTPLGRRLLAWEDVAALAAAALAAPTNGGPRHG